MRNAARVVRLQTLIKEAEELAREESHLQHNDRRLTRLTMVLWVCRDVIDEIAESDAYAEPPPPEGRPERDHY